MIKEIILNLQETSQTRGWLLTASTIKVPPPGLGAPTNLIFPKSHKAPSVCLALGLHCWSNPTAYVNLEPAAS